MIQTKNVTLRFGKRTLFEDVNIKFTNGKTYDVNITINVLENQILRATMLLMKLKKRKSHPKKIG